MNLKEFFAKYPNIHRIETDHSCELTYFFSDGNPSEPWGAREFELGTETRTDMDELECLIFGEEMQDG